MSKYKTKLLLRTCKIYFRLANLVNDNVFSFQLFIFSVMKGPFVEEFFQCVTYAFYTALWQEQIYTTLTLVLMFLLPLLILVATYITTFITIANSGKFQHAPPFVSRQNMFSERVSRTASGDARHKILQKAKVKSLMITVVIVLTFVVCWTPYYVMMIIFMFLDPDEQLSQDLQSAIFFFGSSTALLNPLIYGAFHLRTPRKAARSKSTSFINHSTTSKMDHSVMSSIRRSRQNMFSERVSRTASGDARHKILQKAKVKSLMITVVIVLTFVVCWTPYYVMMIIFMFLDPDEQLSQDLQSAIFFFGSSTALLNPLIYGAFHLRTPRKAARSKSTSFINHSTTSKMDHSVMSSIRRSKIIRKSNDELACFHTNGHLCAPNTSQRKRKPSVVNSYGSSLRKPKSNSNITSF
nr:uncharacterized protein LOC107448213 [Parasteatoda tepidariorum]